MRILTISNVAWDDCNSFGNTMSNWFAGSDRVEFYSIYTRETFPNNKCCKHYYLVTIFNILKNLFSWKKIGRPFEIDELDNSNEIEQIKAKNVYGIKGWKRNILLFAVDMIFSSKIWLNRQLKNYLNVADPDIVFCFAIADSFRYNIIKYMYKHSRAKIVLWIADDVYGQVFPAKSLLDRIYVKRYLKMFAYADKLYGVSQMLCNEYSALYKKEITPLYKGCEISAFKKYVNHPIQIVYAGNLLYGRDETLVEVVKQLKEINKDEIIIQLSIYTNTPLTEAVSKRLNVEGVSTIHGVRPYGEIKRLLSKSDIVLHVESFRPEQIKTVRLSFSTKIIDCMQSGSVMMAIGPKGIASIEYLRFIEGVLVVDCLSMLKSIFKDIVHNPNLLIDKACKLNAFARSKHGINSVRDNLIRDLELLS